jgi:glycosyltransferase involved in cell wall biosynthesis
VVERWWNFGWPPFDFYMKDIDLYHSLHIDIPPTKKIKTVLTVHDCRYMAYPALYSEREVAEYKYRMEKSLNRADMIVTVSKFTRNEVLNHFSFPDERIKVIHNGFNQIPCNDGKLKDRANKFIHSKKLPPSYLICVGTSDPRKNIARLIEAFSLCRKESEDFPHLVIAGIDWQDWVKSGLKIKTEKLGLSNYVHSYGLLEKELLIGLIQMSFILCYPSLYEGFGFPPLEGMSLGIPVLASRTSSIPEIVGDSACLVDPESVEDIATGLIKLVYDQDYRKNLIQSGYQRIKKYSWEKSAKSYIKVYREVLHV